MWSSCFRYRFGAKTRQRNAATYFFGLVRRGETYYDRYEAYVLPKKNTIFARYKFHEKVQGANETLEQFATELKLLVKDCAYANEDEMVRDRTVIGIQSAKVREKL